MLNEKQPQKTQGKKTFYQEQKILIAESLNITRSLLGDDVFKDWLPDLDLEKSLFVNRYYRSVSAKIKTIKTDRLLFDTKLILEPGIILNIISSYKFIS